MNELPSSSDAGQPAGEQSSPMPQASEFAAGASMHGNKTAEPGKVRGAVSRSAISIYVVLLILALLLGAQWWSSQREISSLREEVAQRLRSGDSANTETRVLVKTMQDSLKELQAKTSVLEGKQTEAQSQQLALEQLYQELSRNRDDWALAEIEQILSTASEQLQLAGNVHGALIALQYAESRLSRSDKPQFIMIRRAVARDADRLKALPQIDLTGTVLRIDSAIGQIDSMPLLSDEKPIVMATPPKSSWHASKSASAPSGAAASAGKYEWLAGLKDKWDSLANEMWTDIRQLIRVRDVDTPEALLLSPTQAYYVRENLKLRLLNARLALLTHNDAAFRNDLAAAQDAVNRYFDTRAEQTQATQSLLRKAQASDLSIEMPTLADSLNAVRNYKAKP